jgi:hypothetical protein
MEVPYKIAPKNSQMMMLHRPEPVVWVKKKPGIAGLFS